MPDPCFADAPVFKPQYSTSTSSLQHGSAAAPSTRFSASSSQTHSGGPSKGAQTRPSEKTVGQLRYLTCRLTSLSIASRYEYDAAMQASSLTWHVPCSARPAALHLRARALDGLRTFITRFGQKHKAYLVGSSVPTGDDRQQTSNSNDAG